MRKYTAPLNTAVAARQIEELKATCLGEKAAGVRMRGWSGLSLVAEESRRDPRSLSRIFNCFFFWGGEVRHPYRWETKSNVFKILFLVVYVQSYTQFVPATVGFFFIFI